MQQDQKSEPRLHWREKPLQSIKVAGELTNVSRPTLYKLAEQGKLVFRRLGARRTMVETASIVAYLDSAEPWVPLSRPAACKAPTGGAP
jgi:excisionase family DNA binding protein